MMKPETNSFTTGSLRVKWLDLAREEEVAREEERPVPDCVLRTGFPEPGNLILIATFMKVRRSPPALMIDGGRERFVYLRCRYRGMCLRFWRSQIWSCNLGQQRAGTTGWGNARASRNIVEQIGGKMRSSGVWKVGAPSRACRFIWRIRRVRSADENPTRAKPARMGHPIISHPCH